jgi:signal transduction histidine kinase
LLGVFALYAAEARTPTPADLELLGRATHVAGIAVQRHELDEQLRELAARLEAAREEERSGSAREIHDQLGQSLTAIKLDLSWIARRAASPAGLDIPRDVLLERLRATIALTDEVIQQVRRISAELRPGVLDDLGLTAAIEWQAQEFQKRTGVTCAVSSTLGETHLSRDVSTAVFRICQEALTNVARHANATRVEVSLEGGTDSLRLEVRDDGGGVPAEVIQSPKSLGLLGMRERARHIGGSTEVRAGAEGTLVSLEVPLMNVADREER